MDLDRNLHSLLGEFYFKGKPSRGRNAVLPLIEKERTEELSHLLRDHKYHGVWGNELITRFEVDALIEFYNLLLIAVFSGYIPPDLDSTLRKEIDAVLSDESVKRYYQKYYPYKLTDYTLLYFRKPANYRDRKFEPHLNTFNVFVSLNRLLKNDKDIERFLGMLDHVSYGDNAIDDVIEIFSDSRRLSETVSEKERTAEVRAVWGFFKYTSFLSQFRELLESRDDSPLLQSAMWYYHGYYLDRMNVTMRSLFNKAFSNIAIAVSDPVTFANMAEELYGQKTEPSDFNIEDVKNAAQMIVEKSKDDIMFILDDKWKTPVTEFFNR